MSRIQPIAQPLDIVERVEPGIGLARPPAGKVVFVSGALPGEQVRALRVGSRARHDEAEVAEVLRAAPQRIAARCPAYGRCGGCAVQHQAHDAQIADKEVLLLEKLARLGGVAPVRVLPPLAGAPWGYRARARLGVRYVPGKGGALVGFRERRGARVAVVDGCPVLDPRLSALIAPLRERISALDAAARIPQIEASATADEIALVFRHLDPLHAEDRAALVDFGARYGVRMFLQPGAADTLHPLPPTRDAPLHYTLADHDLRLAFGPLEFTQQNLRLNGALVLQAMNLLAPRPSERLADLFCGIGNFSLPMARAGARVVGLEGDTAAVTRARANAQANALAAVTDFRQADLYDAPAAALALLGRLDGVLLDPPRSGALAACEALPALRPARIVYVSCNPATLARDAAVLVAGGYTLAAAGIVDLFPHTAHVETMALFTREGRA
jgi:23S rRNA (uracil1939-C5)-methyltransferase